jgi:hypothetical protein
VVFLVANFHHFAKSIFQKEYFVTNSPKNEIFIKNLPEIARIAYNMKVVFKIFYFHILNITKFG